MDASFCARLPVRQFTFQRSRSEDDNFLDNYGFKENPELLNMLVKLISFVDRNDQTAVRHKKRTFDQLLTPRSKIRWILDQ